jgi:hypothetical protein
VPNKRYGRGNGIPHSSKVYESYCTPVCYEGALGFTDRGAMVLDGADRLLLLLSVVGIETKARILLLL